MNLRYPLLKLFDCLFPPNDEDLCVREIAEKDMVRLYTPHHIDSIQALSLYQNRKVRALIHEAKFNHNTRAWKLLNILLRLHLSYRKEPIDFIIPIPLSRTRMRTRGYNQVYEIINAYHAPDSIPIRNDILMRTRHTKPQTELPRTARLTNVLDAFQCTNSEHINGKHILLIDDVTTTGATLNAAKTELLSHSPASITCIAIAH